MATRDPSRPSIRFIPDDWLNPMQVQELFDCRQPLEIDLGCGKGRFLLAQAKQHPEVNFLGIDRMLRRIRKVDRKAVRSGLDNVRLVRIEGYYAATYLLPKECARTYYIFFPDPWPKKKHHGHRLFDACFRDSLFKTLEPGGTMHFATDHLPYFFEVHRIMRADGRFEECPAFHPSEEERTDFELLFYRRKPIGRCSFKRV